MPETSRIAGFFAEIEETMSLRFRGRERDILHPGEVGGIRERRVGCFLSSILPKRYGIGTGHIIDSQGGISSQTDIVIHDAMSGMTLPLDDYYSLFPCECVYAAVEVKSTLKASDSSDRKGRGTIYECAESTTQLRSLNRQANHPDLPSILSVVFAYKTDWRKNQDSQVIDWFKKFGEKYDKKIPDIVFVLEPGFVIFPSGLTGYYEEGKDLIAVPWNPLLCFTSRLIHYLSQAKTATPDLWGEYGYFQKKKPYARIHSSASRRKLEHSV